MEKVQNVVSKVSEFGDPDQYGNKNYWIEFQDGSKGSFRTPNNDLFVVGQQSEYSIKEMKQSPKAGNYAILQRYKDDDFGQKKSFHGGSGSTINKEQSEMINRSVAIKAACELLSQSNNNTPERAIEAAEAFFDYINFGVGEKTDTNVAKPISDGLPF